MLSCVQETIKKNYDDDVINDGKDDVITVEHVTFSVTIDDGVERRPTMVAETKKHAEKQILQQVSLSFRLVFPPPW